MYSMSSCASLEMAAFAARFPRPGEGCEKDSVTAKNHVLDSRHGRDWKGNARLERAYPEDFRARRSPTANVSADVIARAMETGYLNKDDGWEIVFETGALMQGLIMLYLGGRMAMSPSEFQAFCHRSFGRYLNGILT